MQVGESMIITGASGAIPRSDRDRMENHASLYYEEIRKRDSDTEAISKNTGISVDDIQKVRSIFSKIVIISEGRNRNGLTQTMILQYPGKD